METSNRGLQLTQANLQAQRPSQRQAHGGSTNLVASNISYSSAANSTVGDLPGTAGGGGGGGPAGVRMSKRPSVSSTIDHYTSQNNYPYQSNVRLENTYRLGPHDSQRFNAARVTRIVNEIMRAHLENAKYEPNKCRDLVQLLSEEIKSRVKSILYKRYKLIVNLTIGQSVASSLMMASRSLWNPETDNECTVTYKNNSLFAIATIFACYYD